LHLALDLIDALLLRAVDHGNVELVESRVCYVVEPTTLASLRR
jgi:hypothetical protein